MDRNTVSIYIHVECNYVYMTERLRTWVSGELDTLVSALDSLGVEITKLRALNTAASSTVQSRATTYTRNLATITDKNKQTLESTRSTARALVNALLALSDNQTLLADRLDAVNHQLDTLNGDIETLRSEILRELTKLRSTAAAGAWHTEASQPNVGTYLNAIPHQTE